MNITCDIIRDLLPLYAEEMVSPDSRELVEEHLSGCERCTQELKQLKTQEKLPLEVQTESLDKVKKSIHIRRILAVMTAVFLVATLVSSVVMFLDSKVYLKAEEAILGVERLEDGSVTMYLSPIVSGTGSCAELDGDNNYGMISYANMGTYLFPERVLQSAERRAQEQGIPVEELLSHTYSTAVYGPAFADYTYWYVDARTGKADTLLLQGKGEDHGLPLKNVNYHLAWYCAGLLALAAVLVLLSRIPMRRWTQVLLQRLAALSVSLSVGTAVACGFQFVELWGEFTEYFQDGTVVALPMTLCILCFLQLRELNRKDSGM